MATPVYPQILPTPLISGYSYQDKNKFIRTKVDEGLARQRRRFTKTPTLVQANILLLRSQLSYFESWYFNEIDSGASFFELRLSLGGYVRTVNARFTEEYKIKSESDKFRLSAKLEIEEKPIDPILDADTIELIELYGWVGLEVLIDRLDFWVNSELKEVF